MTKVLKKLGAGSLALVLGALLFVSVVSAESPPNPPARFAGTVLVDGVAPAAGTLIEAKIGAATCGVATVFKQGADSRYVLDSPALDPGATPNCGTDGAVVAFFVGGPAATQVGSWKNYDINVLNLTVVTPPSPTATPKPPSTGAGAATGSGTEAAWLFAAFGLGALAFGIGGATVARRRG